MLVNIACRLVYRLALDYLVSVCEKTIDYRSRLESEVQVYLIGVYRSIVMDVVREHLSHFSLLELTTRKLPGPLYDIPTPILAPLHNPEVRVNSLSFLISDLIYEEHIVIEVGHCYI